MKKYLLNRKLIYNLSLFVVLLDQASKAWAQSNLEHKNSVVLINNIINLTLVKNTGAAFSLLSQSTIFLGILSLIVAITLIIWIWTSKQIRFWQGLGFSLLLGGTIGNGIDRFRLGFVYDFIELIPINFPIFNIADISINLAIICLLINLRKTNKLSG